MGHYKLNVALQNQVYEAAPIDLRFDVTSNISDDVFLSKTDFANQTQTH